MLLQVKDFCQWVEGNLNGLVDELKAGTGRRLNIRAGRTVA